jgi:hypothetical protein
MARLKSEYSGKYVVVPVFNEIGTPTTTELAIKTLSDVINDLLKFALDSVNDIPVNSGVVWINI